MDQNLSSLFTFFVDSIGAAACQAVVSVAASLQQLSHDAVVFHPAAEVHEGVPVGVGGLGVQPLDQGGVAEDGEGHLGTAAGEDLRKIFRFELIEENSKEREKGKERKRVQ